MIQEVVHVKVDPAQRDEFIQVWKKAWEEVAYEGAHSGQIFSCVEDTSKVMLILDWDSLEAHLQHRGSERQQRYRARFTSYIVTPSVIEHYTMEPVSTVGA